MQNEKYYAVILDDDPLCVSNIESSLLKYPEIMIVGRANDATSGMKLIFEHKPNLVFSDVEMPGETGVEMLSMLDGRITWPMQVIFCTAYEKYLISAIRASALDFLLKPYSEVEFAEVMKHFFTKAREANYIFSVKQLTEKLNMVPPKGIMIPISQGFNKIKLERIIYFEYHQTKRLWLLMQSDNSVLEVKRGINAEDILSYSDQFVQTNQYQILNLNYISSVQTKHCLLEPPYNKEILIGNKYKKELYKKLDIE